MFKVIAPQDRKDGNGKYWMRLGSAFVNKDNSINVYLDAVPFGQKDGLMVQLREYTEDELRERSERKSSSYSARGTLGQSSLTDPNMFGSSPALPSTAADDGTPF
jgi:hypothetical protein